MITVATLAEAEFQKRLKAAKALRRANKWTADFANQRLTPWLVIALKCGADLWAHLDEDMQWYARQGCDAQRARTLALWSITDTAAMAREIEHAYQNARGLEASDLYLIGNHLGLDMRSLYIAKHNQQQDLAA